MYRNILFIFIAWCICLPFTTEADVETAGVSNTSLFQEQGFGYVIKYPSDWIYEVSAGKTIIFSGARGTKAYFSTVSIQNLLSTKKEGGKFRDIDAVADDLINQLKTAQDMKMSVIKPFSYSKGRMRLDGKQFTTEYSLQGVRYKQWVIVLPGPKGDIFHTWFYTSPLNQYNNFESISQAMLDSWTIIEQE